MDRATVVGWYGIKPGGLADLLSAVQQAVGTVVGHGFTPRPPTDLHATIIGLETGVEGAAPDLDGLVRYLAAELEREPLDVQFGGFADTDRRMRSGGETLYRRSLVLQGTALVLVGWPMAPGPSARLGEIRRRCERYGFRHKYHRRPQDLDADVYLVVGDIAEPARAAELVDRVRREVLATAVRVALKAADLSLVEYLDPRLPVATSRRRPLVTG
ncbi:MAG TPA: hypothetical protein VGE11_14925 [Pseudonocardia sp.]